MNTPTRRYKKYILLTPALKQKRMSLGKKLLLTLFAIAIIVGFTRGQMSLNAPTASASTEEVQSATSTVSDAPCLKLGAHTFFCGDDAGKDSKIKDLYNENQKLKSKEVKAFVTMYSRKDSCHNPSGNKCLTAAGRDTKAGVTVACPRNLKLGTKVMIDGFTYTCEDRYSTYLDAKRGLPTFDIFTEDQSEALKWGIKERVVTIVN